MPFAATWMKKLEILLLGEVSWKEKDIHNIAKICEEG